MTNYDVVKKLIGPINPIGKSEVDEDRMKNLAATLDLIEKLTDDVLEVAKIHHNGESSIKQAKDYASGFIRRLSEDNLDNLV